MRKIGFCFLSMLSIITGAAQQGVGIGTTTPHASAMVDASKNNKGILIPRMTTTARNSISNPADGLIVYDSTSNRLYQYQENTWVYMVNNSYWVKTPSTNFIYSFDSVGIGTNSPSEKLDVNGNIRGRGSLKVDFNLAAVNTLQGDDIALSGNVLAAGIAHVGGDITTQAGVDISGTTVQFKSSVDNKAFMQVSGDDMRLGTNSGNTTGKTIIRMNGSDVISIDTSASLKVLISGNGGKLTMGSRLSRQIAPDDNMLAITSGRINADGTLLWMSDNTPADIEKIGTGTYKIKFWSARLSARSAILVTAAGTAPRTCSAIFIAPPNGSYLLVEIYDPVSRVFADTDFNFIIQDPLNIF